MITKTLAETISQSGDFGLAQAFRHQLMPAISLKPKRKPKPRPPINQTMNEELNNLITTLREELTQWGEVLALMQEQRS